MGYKIALWRDSVEYPFGIADYVRVGKYPGYARAVNALAFDVLRDWIVTGGDDTDPDPNLTAEEIAAQLTAHFGGTFGVCQPTGDRFAFSKAQGSAPIDRVAGSPWLGREWCLRANQGKGPLWPEYTHMFVDEELQNVAIKYGVFWQRPDLIHLHHHYQRVSDAINSPAQVREAPPHLVEVNKREHWDKYKAIFEARRRAGFPGSEPL